MTATPSDHHVDLIRSVLTEVVPGLAWTPISPEDTFTGTLSLDSLTIASFAVALNKTLATPQAIETWIADASASGADTVGGLATWLADTLGARL